MDELDPEDNVYVRLAQAAELRDQGLHQAGGGVGRRRHGRGDHVPARRRSAWPSLPPSSSPSDEPADPEVIHKQVMHPAEGTLVEVRGRLDVTVDPATLVIPAKQELLSEEEIRDYVNEHGLKVVAATVGNDEHSVGMREIIDIKHGGLEKFGVECYYLGTSVPVEKLLDAAIEHAADAVLLSTIISHGEVHRLNMEKIADLATEKGVRDKLLLIAGGTQVTDELARSWGMDAGFGRGTHGADVASFMVEALRKKQQSGRPRVKRRSAASTCWSRRSAPRPPSSRPLMGSSGPKGAQGATPCLLGQGAAPTSVADGDVTVGMNAARAALESQRGRSRRNSSWPPAPPPAVCA